MTQCHVDTNEIVQRLNQCLNKHKKPIGLHEPLFQGNEWKYTKECLDTGWVSSVGKFVDLFENQLAEYTGVKRAVAIVNGTAALHIGLKLVGVEAGDEVLVPALSFVATANAVAHCGAYPHFIDSAENTLGMDPVKLQFYLKEIVSCKNHVCINKLTGRRIKAVVPMHTFGHPVDMDPLVEVCQRYQLDIVEDAAEALGSFYKGRHMGQFGKISALSFNGNKIVTTGGGGALLTNDVELGRLAKHLTTTARVPHRWLYQHDAVGYNYRMPNINAALGCAQLEQLPLFLERKRKLFSLYQESFSDCSSVQLFQEPSFAHSNYWLNALLIKEDNASVRDKILEKTNACGISTRPCWTLLNQLPMYQECPKMDLSQAEGIARRLINIPSSVFLYE